VGVELSSSAGRPGAAKPTINVTPLVDVVLVLLIIFMVLIPNVQQGVPVELIKVEHGARVANEPPDEAFAVVSIQRDGTSWLGEQPLERAELLAALRAGVAGEGGRATAIQAVRLRADARIPYGELRPWLAELRALGLQDIRLAVGVDTDTAAAQQGGAR
jgi:biopolymer transport protein ExbD